MKTSHPVYSPADDPEGLSNGEMVVWGKDIFIGIGGLEPHGVVSWNLDQGVQPLLRWPGDHTRAASLLGTDGKDMVWWYGEGKNLGETVFPKRSVMTAPYTTDPAVIQTTAKRLRSDPAGLDYPATWAVGCGYAARAGFVDGLNWELSVVRIQDGASWILPGTIDGTSIWAYAMGVTCDEVFVLWGSQGIQNIVRLRLDSLGPPLTPD